MQTQILFKKDMSQNLTNGTIIAVYGVDCIQQKKKLKLDPTMK